MYGSLTLLRSAHKLLAQIRIRISYQIIIFLLCICKLFSLEYGVYYFEMRCIVHDVLAISTGCDHCSISTNYLKWYRIKTC